MRLVYINSLVIEFNLPSDLPDQLAETVRLTIFSVANEIGLYKIPLSPPIIYGVYMAILSGQSISI